MDIVSIVLGVIALATAFTPLIWLQVIGGFVGIAGIALAWRAKKADYRKSLTTEQSRELSAHYKLLSPQLDYIETHGGGSARCMLAELF